MEHARFDLKSRRRSKLFWLLVCCAFGIAVNMIGVLISRALHLPLFFNSVGTILTAATGGSLPGILVAFLTNLICGAIDSVSLYYSGLNVIIALAAGIMSWRGWFKRAKTILPAILLFAVVGGVLGAALSNLMGAFSLSESTASSVATHIFEAFKISEGASVYLANMLVDLADKTVGVLLAAAAQKFLPSAFLDKIRFAGWMQNPMSPQMRREVRSRKVRGASLRFKIPALIAIASLLVSIGALGSAFNLYRDNALEDHKELGAGIAKLVASEIDGDMIDKYFEEGDGLPGYADTEEHLYAIYNSSTDIQYIYVYQIREDGCHVVFDLDTPDLEGGNLGDFIGFDDTFLPYVPSLLKGDPIEPIISDETFGWLITFYEPVYDSAGQCKAYAAADISMNLLNRNNTSFLVQSCSMFLGFFIVVLSIGLWVAENSITIPINSIDLVSGSVKYDSRENRTESLQRIEALQIRSGDEIENLYDSLLDSTQNTIRYIEESEHRADIIEKMQSGLIILMADLVESRDKSTGDHIRKTAAYVRIIIDELIKEGVYTEELTDEYVSKVVNLAPLHDIGKIHVSDAILNKPGKLTDDEFKKMKGHTTAGFEILVNAKDLVPEAEYLEEAQNLAAYHHERWDGKGYPNGLGGEDIPLSARIMSVADVFDALVSRRCYKPPFSYDTALNIIQEGAGSQFDPKIVAAFLNAKDSVLKVAQEHSLRENAVETPPDGKTE